ncbi:MAG: helix-turn-helix transcriptional regulator [Hyphomicrobium sp.]|jgi:AraC family transcriptional regulator
MQEAHADRADFSRSGVHFSPADIAHRRQTRWNGVAADSVEFTRREPFAYRIQSHCHTLIVSERQSRNDGETSLEGLPKSNLREFSHKLSFVPSGHRFCGWQKPRVLGRVTFLYLDPKAPFLDPGLRLSENGFKPRLFFFDQDIWETALKLKAQAGQENSSGYAEALALVLTHELIRLDRPASPFMPVRGGLATWQQKKVSEYVEEHLNADISLNTLAGIAELSPYHFARAFKQSFGAPPHRYVTDRRIVRAKALLENPARTVTEVGIEVGFAETSSFTATFRRMTGMTPTDYRRHLG